MPGRIRMQGSAAAMKRQMQFQHRVKAVKVIQRAFRRHLQRRRHKQQKELEKLNRHAQKIQEGWYGYVLRENEKSDVEFQQWKKRHHIKVLRFFQLSVRRVIRRIRKASIVLQRNSVKWMTHCRYLRVIVCVAVLKIQKLYRRHRRRKVMEAEFLRIEELLSWLRMEQLLRRNLVQCEESKRGYILGKLDVALHPYQHRMTREASKLKTMRQFQRSCEELPVHWQVCLQHVAEQLGLWEDEIRQWQRVLTLEVHSREHLVHEESFCRASVIQSFSSRPEASASAKSNSRVLCQQKILARQRMGMHPILQKEGEYTRVLPLTPQCPEFALYSSAKALRDPEKVATFSLTGRSLEPYTYQKTSDFVVERNSFVVPCRVHRQAEHNVSSLSFLIRDSQNETQRFREASRCELDTNLALTMAANEVDAGETTCTKHIAPATQLGQCLFIPRKPLHCRTTPPRQYIKNEHRPGLTINVFTPPHSELYE